MTYDVIVIGGSYAGISAALQIARARKNVLVVDAGARRNRTASSSHGFLGFDGADPALIAKTGKEQLLAYPTVTWRQGVATNAKKVGDGFEVAFEGGEVASTRRIVLATGVVDDLPKIPGVQERWGVSIFACPYCHGYELDRGNIAVLATAPHSAHHAALVADWGTVTYFTNGFPPDDAGRALLAKRGVTIDDSPIAAVEGEGHEVVVRFAADRTTTFAGLFLASRTRIATPIPTELGCAFEDGPTGPFLKIDPMTKETTVPGVFACGDAATPAAAVAIAVGDGMRAGASAHQSLIFR